MLNYFTIQVYTTLLLSNLLGIQLVEKTFKVLNYESAWTWLGHGSYHNSVI